jgi:heavy metal sensor kinase
VNTKSIRFRLIAGYTGLIVMVVVGFGIYTYFKVDAYLNSALRDSLLNRAERIAAMFQTEVMMYGEQAVIDQVKTRFTPEANDRFCRISEKRAGILYASGEPNDKSFDSRIVPLIDRWDRPTSTTALHAGGTSKLLVVTTKATVGNRTYLIELGYSEGDNDRVLRGVLATLFSGLPVVIGVAVIGGYILLQRAFRPVREMIEKANEISRSGIHSRLPVRRTGDDLEQLSITLNKMIHRLEKSFENSRRFTSDASHELRTPLTIIRGELEQLLVYQDGNSERVKLEIGSLLEETDRLIAIVRGLLALSRLDAGEAQREDARFDLGELATATTEQMSLLAEEKGVELCCTSNPRVEVRGDRSRLKQVIVNLLDNAIKYTPTNGKIALAVRAAKGHAYLEVCDTGIGVPAEDLPRIFDRFYRVDQVRSRVIEGAGLGLSIVWSICTAHGGTVYAENLASGGSRFTAELPLAD